ncbi:hypothetical protein ACRCUN_06410 [Mycobacterium sp. LTG2003]
MSISMEKVTKAGIVGAVASAMAVGAFGATAPAHAWCVGISGLNFGGGCSSTLGNFALGLGPNAVASSSGFITGAIALGDAFASSAGILTASWAGGTGSESYTNGLFNWAVAQGTNASAVAGRQNTDFANFAFNFGNAVEPWLGGENEELGTSNVDASFGSFNLAANLGGNANAVEGTTKDLRVWAGGLEGEENFGSAALNLFGNRNDVQAFGSGVAAIAVGNPFGFPNGSDSIVRVGDFVEGISGGSLSLAFNIQPPFITEECGTGQCGNTVTVSDGYLSIAGAVGLVNRVVEQIGPGIRINTPFNPPPTVTNVLAADSTSTATTPKASAPKSLGDGIKGTKQRSLVRSSLDFSGGAKADADRSDSTAKAADQGSSAPKSLKSRINETKKKVSDAVSKVTGKKSTKANADAGDSDDE